MSPTGSITPPFPGNYIANPQDPLQAKNLSRHLVVAVLTALSANRTALRQWRCRYVRPCHWWPSPSVQKAQKSPLLCRFSVFL